MENGTNCAHPTHVHLDCRVGYSDISVGVNDEYLIDAGGTEDPEEVEFPSEVTDLGIENDSGGSVVTVSLKVCLTCRKVI